MKMGRLDTVFLFEKKEEEIETNTNTKRGKLKSLRKEKRETMGAPPRTKAEKAAFRAELIPLIKSGMTAQEIVFAKLCSTDTVHAAAREHGLQIRHHTLGWRNPRQRNDSAARKDLR